MGFNCGIVGLPNVGKSTLFNALTATAAAEAANYPFTTVDPNIGRVGVPDGRLTAVARLDRSARTVPAGLQFVDIAGLVRGASKGEGLGNRFLAHIREVDAVCHVLRCFADDDVAHVEGRVDPLGDADIVETELMLADLEVLERRVEPIAKKAMSGEREAQAEIALIEPILAALRDGRRAESVEVAGEDARRFRMLQLLTAKPMLYVCNVGEADAASGNALSDAVAARAAAEGAASVVISVEIEKEVARLDDAGERRQYLETLGLEDAGLARVIAAGYALLGLITFFTANANEAHAWTVPGGATALEAAGAVHSDFRRGFISAETVAYEDYVDCAGEQGAKEAGRMRQEGRDYVVRDGDVIRFRFNV